MARQEPLPHQITAVYEEMLPRQPLRFLLAGDPGVGKTIMAGLLIKELIARLDNQAFPGRGRAAEAAGAGLPL
jgi:DNA polymerase III delta prime subunit